MLLAAYSRALDAEPRERRRFQSTKLKTCVAQSASNNVLATTDCSGALLVKRRRPIGLLVRPDHAAADCRRWQHRIPHPLPYRLARALLIAPIGQPAERQTGEIGERAKREQNPGIGEQKPNG